MDATTISMVYTVTNCAQQTVKWVHVMMSQVTVLRDATVDSMVLTVTTLVLQIVIRLSATKILATVTLDVLLGSLAINAMKNVLITALVLVTNPVVLARCARKLSLVGNVANIVPQIVRTDVKNLMENVTVVAIQVSMV